VRDSDATVLFSIDPTLTGGSKRTMEFARKHGKPHLHLCAGNDSSADNLRAFFEYHDVKVLNVAGPRASKEPGVGEFVARILEEAFGEIARPDHRCSGTSSSSSSSNPAAKALE
jgi:hypothetical protein